MKRMNTKEQINKRIDELEEEAKERYIEEINFRLIIDHLPKEKKEEYYRMQELVKTFTR